MQVKHLWAVANARGRAVQGGHVLYTAFSQSQRAELGQPAPGPAPWRLEAALTLEKSCSLILGEPRDKGQNQRGAESCESCAGLPRCGAEAHPPLPPAAACRLAPRKPNRFGNRRAPGRIASPEPGQERAAAGTLECKGSESQRCAPAGGPATEEERAMERELGCPSHPGHPWTWAQFCSVTPNVPHRTHSPPSPARPELGAPQCSRADRLALTLRSRSCRRRPILGLAQSPSRMPGSLGHPRGAGRRVRAQAAPGGRPGSCAAAGGGGARPRAPRPRSPARRALALPFPGKSSRRFPTQPDPQPPLGRRREPASPPPPPPRCAPLLASAPRPLAWASPLLLSPPLRSLRRLAPQLPPSPRLPRPLSFPGPAPRALAALTPFPRARVCDSRRGALAALAAAAARGEAGVEGVPAAPPSSAGRGVGPDPPRLGH
ncbi:uncharacterized protein LOC130839624 [Hippopotamus amphibius kiboko]|uniref:uncharacterized protein LOC130839624 n=1 Tax=Hippopotamus amphibius kiboko TaxID=575201 RepID=UPI0025986660|nr:uncharacterized protein LOC130839624 [Hippopotamus amphibius kiboko]